MTERERFEAWYRSRHPHAELFRENGDYYYPVSCAWEAWQAARKLDVPSEVLLAVIRINYEARYHRPPFSNDNRIVAAWAIENIPELKEQTQ